MTVKYKDGDVVADYAGFYIQFAERAGAAPGRPGFVVVDPKASLVNVLPAATYAKTPEGAKQLIDVFLAVGQNGQAFWHLLRAIQRGAANAIDDTVVGAVGQCPTCRERMDDDTPTMRSPTPEPVVKEGGFALFTPGPWMRDGRFVYALMSAGFRNGKEQFKNRFMANVQPDGECPEPEALATAVLIQNAPKLYEAAAEIEGALKRAIYKNRHASPTVTMSARQAKEILKALADARGEKIDPELM